MSYDTPTGGVPATTTIGLTFDGYTPEHKAVLRERMVTALAPALARIGPAALKDWGAPDPRDKTREKAGVSHAFRLACAAEKIASAAVNVLAREYANELKRESEQGS